MVTILTRIRENDKAYEKGQEAARKQARTTYNFLSMNSSTPIKSTVTTEYRQQPPERTTHFNPNTMHQYYSTTEPTSHTNQCEPPANGSIIKGAGTAPMAHFAVRTTAITSAETRVETEGTNKITGLTKEIIAFKTGTATTKTEIGLTTEDDQANTNTTEINPEHR